MNIIGQNCAVHPSVRIGAFTVIGDNVTLSEGVVIGNHAIIHDDTVVEPNVMIHDGAVLGKLPMRAARSATTSNQSLDPCHVGANTTIGTYVILYRGCLIGNRVLIADFATVREKVIVGDMTILGRGVAVENGTSIGARCKIETNAYITAFTTIEDDVFIAPVVTTSNDNYLGRTEERFKHFGGPKIGRFARIGANAVILPNKRIGSDALVAAGAVVSKDVPNGTLVMGVPARSIGPIKEEQQAVKQT